MDKQAIIQEIGAEQYQALLLSGLNLGDIDLASARAIFQQLDLPADDQEVIALREALQEE